MREKVFCGEKYIVFPFFYFYVRKETKKGHECVHMNSTVFPAWSTPQTFGLSDTKSAS